MRSQRMILILAFIALAAPVTATNLATIQYGSAERTSNSQAEYTVGLVNLGNQTLKIELRTSADNTSIISGSNTAVNPSEVSDNPNGEGWLALSGGRYAKVVKHSFTVSADKFRNLSFPVTLRAYPEAPAAGSGLQTLIQARTYDFRILNSTALENVLRFEDEDDENNELRDRNSRNLTVNLSESKNSQISKDEEERGKEISPILLVAAGLSTIYLLKVIIF